MRAKHPKASATATPVPVIAARADGAIPAKQILVLKLGWVLVGNVYEKPETNELEVTCTHVVRVWGTTNGLGEIAIHGPTPKTVLDLTGNAWVNVDAVLFRIDVDASKWEEILGG